MTAPDEIISEEEIVRVHGHADFGDMNPREVVNDGVLKYAIGFSGGYTQLSILREHGLITKPKPGKYSANLTQKGKRYARSFWRSHKDALADRDREIERLRKEADDYALKWATVCDERDRLQAELAAAKEAVTIRQVALEQRTAENDKLQARLAACPTVEQLRYWGHGVWDGDAHGASTQMLKTANRMEALNDR